MHKIKQYRCGIVLFMILLLIATGCGQKKLAQIQTEVQIEMQKETEPETQKILQGKVTQMEEEGNLVEPVAFQIEMENIIQNPELPTGCESVALTMVLNYYGFHLTKTAIADEYLVFSENFAEGYLGDPHTEEGAGIFPPGIAETANDFLKEQGSALAAKDISGTEPEELYQMVAADRPVLIWNTMHMQEADKTDEVCEYNGKTYQWYYNEHCVVFCGYDKDAGTVWINDPLDGLIERNADEFWRLYHEAGKYAVVIA